MAMRMYYDGVEVGTVKTTTFTTDTANGTITLPWSPALDSGVWTHIVRTSTTSTGGEWMAHPMTADEIIDQAARELARKRPAD